MFYPVRLKEDSPNGLVINQKDGNVHIHHSLRAQIEDFKYLYELLEGKIVRVEP